jgi:ribose/xylose/arabinose/galactoside ABC-type transport system permease subunit
VGAVILGVLSNGLVMLSVPYYAMDIIKGLVLAGALALTFFSAVHNILQGKPHEKDRFL